MNLLEPVFKKTRRLIKILKGEHFTISFNKNKINLFDNSFETLASSTPTNKDLAENDIERLFINNLSKVPYFYGFNNQDILFKDIMADILGNLEYFTCANNEDSKLNIISPYKEDQKGLYGHLQALNSLFKKYFNTEFDIDVFELEHVKDIMLKNYDEAYEFYYNNKGSFINNLIENMDDKLSQISYLHFINKRIQAKIFYGVDTAYPIVPPKETDDIRNTQLNKNVDLPILFNKNNEKIKKITYTHIYLYEQYCIPGIVEPKSGSAIIDAGAYIGDTSLWFGKKVGDRGKVFAFEPSPLNIRAAERNMKIDNISNVEFLPYALGDTSKKVFLKPNMATSSADRIMEENDSFTTEEINMISVDELSDKLGKFDFLKADIEGCEMQLLHGARNSIREQKPVCAICLYHKKDDFWEIPDYLKSLNPDYKFYFRMDAEPVLFAI